MINIKGWIRSNSMADIEDAGRGYGHYGERDKEIKEDCLVFEKPLSIRKQESGSLGRGDYLVIVIEFNSFFVWKMYSEEAWNEILKVAEEL